MEAKNNEVFRVVKEIKKAGIKILRDSKIKRKDRETKDKEAKTNQSRRIWRIEGQNKKKYKE